MPDPNLPPDPFNSESIDLTAWAANCRSMYTSLVAAGFKDNEAFEFVLRTMIAIMTKSIK